jgi:hypothetical protein
MVVVAQESIYLRNDCNQQMAFVRSHETLLSKSKLIQFYRHLEFVKVRTLKVSDTEHKFRLELGSY